MKRGPLSIFAAKISALSAHTAKTTIVACGRIRVKYARLFDFRVLFECFS